MRIMTYEGVQAHCNNALQVLEMAEEVEGSRSLTHGEYSAIKERIALARDTVSRLPDTALIVFHRKITEGRTPTGIQVERLREWLTLLLQ